MAFGHQGSPEVLYLLTNNSGNNGNDCIMTTMHLFSTEHKNGKVWLYLLQVISGNCLAVRMKIHDGYQHLPTIIGFSWNLLSLQGL